MVDLAGAYFTAVDLAKFARELDDAEMGTMAEGGVDSAEFVRFMQQPSANMDDSGYFSVQVECASVVVVVVVVLLLSCIWLHFSQPCCHGYCHGSHVAMDVAMDIAMVVCCYVCVQVICEALVVWCLSMVPLSSPEMKSAMETPTYVRKCV